MIFIRLTGKWEFSCHFLAVQCKKAKAKNTELEFLIGFVKIKHNKVSPLLAPNNVKNHFLGEPPDGYWSWWCEHCRKEIIFCMDLQCLLPCVCVRQRSHTRRWYYYYLFRSIFCVKACLYGTR